MAGPSQKVEFFGHSGAELAARLDLPSGQVRAYALFAHCFTCSKDFLATRRIAGELARMGIAVLRFDFTGLGSSEGEFGSTNFSSNVADLLGAADFLRRNYQAPAILIGHSLGGAAVLSAARDIPEARAVVSIGAPADAAHLLKSFGKGVAEIEQAGEAEVVLQGRAFRVERQFLDDIRSTRLLEAVSALKKPLLILHSPIDQTVGIDNASRIFQAAKHPKSFISLNDADHLLTRPDDAEFAGHVIAAWVTRYIGHEASGNEMVARHARVSETGEGRFQNTVQVGRHRLFADEPHSFGGLDSGPSPYDFLAIALGACTSMTLRIYAEARKLPIGRISVNVLHSKLHAEDCENCAASAGGGDRRIDRFERVISVDGPLADDLKDTLVEIAGKCPVHRTLSFPVNIATSVKAAE
jgi:putative redox protein